MMKRCNNIYSLGKFKFVCERKLGHSGSHIDKLKDLWKFTWLDEWS